MYIFLSHSSKDHAVAEELCGILEGRGHVCFLAPRDIRSGHEYAEEIIDGIERSEVMLLLLSEAANQSPHVLREVERAVSKKIQIVVYQLEKVTLSKSMEYFLMSHQWVDTAANTGYDGILNCMEELSADGHTVQQPEIEQQKTAGLTAVLKKHSTLVLAVILFILVVALIPLLLQQKDKTADVPVTPEVVSDGVNEETSLPVATPTATLGDTVLFGSYQGEPIEWRVLKLHEDGTAVLVSTHILTMKAFDAAESGKYNSYDGVSYWLESAGDLEPDLQIKLRGNNQWSTSNIRTWLNSDRENVIYEDQAPTARAMSELVNGYDMEPGFLSGFDEEELAAIVSSQIITGENISEDRVFLLSAEELAWFEEADVSMLAVPLESAVEQDKTGWYRLFALDYNVEDYYWWLRDAVETEAGLSAYEAYVVSNSYAHGKLISKSVGLEGFGIRPAITVNLSAECIEIKNGE